MLCTQVGLGPREGNPNMGWPGSTDSAFVALGARHLVPGTPGDSAAGPAWGDEGGSLTISPACAFCPQGGEKHGDASRQ